MPPSAAKTVRGGRYLRVAKPEIFPPYPTPYLLGDAFGGLAVFLENLLFFQVADKH